MFSFDEKILWLDENKYQYKHSVSLCETAKDGKAILHINSTNKLFAISLSHKGAIKVFKHKNVADWIVLEFLDYNEINLHLIELKRTITADKWEQVKKQFLGALQHSFLLQGLFGYNLKNVILYTAFVNNKFDIKNTTNPTLLKFSLGTNEKSSAVDWGKDKIMILNKRFQHKKIKLNLQEDIGVGEYEF